MLKNVLILSEGLVLQDADVWGKTLKNGTPHSRYFSDELGVPNFLS